MLQESSSGHCAHRNAARGIRTSGCKLKMKNPNRWYFIFFDRSSYLEVVMPVMKIRGGDLDLVEYEFRTFVPGANIKTLGYDKRKYKLTPFNGTVHVIAPALLRSSVPAELWKSIIQGSQSSAIL